MESLDDFYYFAKVVEHEGYAAAGRALGIPKSRLSRHVSDLETRLKVRLPAKRVPDAIEAWIKLYESQRNEGEAFNDFFDRVGAVPFEEAAKGIALPVEFNLESLEHFIDWSRSEPYQVIRGEGECAV